MVSQHRNANGFYCTLRCANRKESQKLNFAKCQGRGQGGVIIFFSLFYVSSNFKRIFFSKNRRTLFGALKYRQTLFNAQILLYKDFCDFFAIYTAIVHRKCFSTICNTNLQSKFASNISSWNLPGCTECSNYGRFWLA